MVSIILWYSKSDVGCSIDIATVKFVFLIKINHSTTSPWPQSCSSYDNSAYLQSEG
ncbi:hypothetical protein KP509_38G040300 [Ceratopteris richardii]|uniref:Uncharacterized protein n=1 Tax=Ceratopteris richardii TaxID=49495 RepID=A0A8T2Q3U6_CERRI|nr:hypothetical protein KP509_38G040300 [Ceratopteris richardii]